MVGERRNASLVAAWAPPLFLTHPHIHLSVSSTHASTHITMEAASIARRERLAALKKRKLDGSGAAPRQPATAHDDDDEVAPEDMDAASLVRTFRNYDQSTGQAKRAKLGQIQDTIENGELRAVE